MVDAAAVVVDAAAAVAVVVAAEKLHHNAFVATRTLNCSYVLHSLQQMQL